MSSFFHYHTVAAVASWHGGREPIPFEQRISPLEMVIEQELRFQNHRYPPCILSGPLSTADSASDPIPDASAESALTRALLDSIGELPQP